MEPTILVPVNDSLTTRKTIDDIIAQKERFPRKLVLLHVVDDLLAYRMIPDFQIEMVRENAEKAVRSWFNDLTGQLKQQGFEIEQRLVFGAPRQVIPQIANDEKFQLLVIGRKAGRGEISAVVFGSVANYVLHNVHCPVLLM
jgi:nucleotide-binding universal stress UspA family protein